MHTNPPPPYTATTVVHLVGGPLCGESHEIPAHCSALSWTTDDCLYCDGIPGHLTVSLAGHAYFFNPFASERLGRPTFTHGSLPWNFCMP